MSIETIPSDLGIQPDSVECPDGGQVNAEGQCRYQYDREAAVLYAIRYNSEDDPHDDVVHYKSMGNTNCTVYASEVLAAGGYPMAYAGGAAQIASDLKAGLLNDETQTPTATAWACAMNGMNKAEGTQVWRVAPRMRKFFSAAGAVSVTHDVSSYRAQISVDEGDYAAIFDLCDQLAEHDIGSGDLIYWGDHNKEHFAVIVGWGVTAVANPSLAGIKLNKHQYWGWDRKKVPNLTFNRGDRSEVPYILDYGRNWADITHPIPFYLMALDVKIGGNCFIAANMEFVQVPREISVAASDYVRLPYIP